MEDMTLPFRLPAKVEKIYQWLRRRSPNVGKQRYINGMDQPE